MSVIIDGDTGIDKITDGSIVAADIGAGEVGATQLASTLDLSSKTVTLATNAVDQLSTASGSAPSYSARAWVNFNGTGTVAIRDSGNVTSITDNGTGNYTVNFTTAMPDANYSCVGVCGTAGVTQGLFVNQSSTASVANVFTVNTGGTLTDYQQVMLNIHR
jgi:hypothetical protein